MNFIVVGPPGQQSPGVQRRAHAHAARAAHARARLARVAEYEKQKRKKKQIGAEDGAEVSGVMPVLPARAAGFLAPGHLASFLRSLSPWESSLFDYYLGVVVPQLQRDCVLIRFTSSQPDFVAGWLPFSAADPDLLRGLLLTACRHRAVHDAGAGYAQFAAGYKARQLRVVRESIADGSVAARRRAVTRAIMLVVDEIYLGDIAMASRHAQGVLDIILASGGPDALGLSGLVRYLVCASLYGKRLLDWDAELLERTRRVRDDLVNF